MEIVELSGFEGVIALLVGWLIVCAFQLTLYLVVCGGVAGFYAMWSAIGVGEPIDPGKRHPLQIQQELKWGVLTCLVIASYLFVAMSFIKTLYPVNSETAVLNVVGFLVVYDFYMYITHRLLHTPVLAPFHSRHHKAVRATPWSSLNMHPVEAVINYLPFLIFAVVAEVSLVAYLGIHAYLTFGIANSHGNYNLFAGVRRVPLLHELTTFHQGHHSKPDSNYGFLLTHWDWVFRTRSHGE